MVKSPFQEVDLGNTAYILGTKLYSPSAEGRPRVDSLPLYLKLRRGRVTRSAHICIPGWKTPTLLY